MAAETMDAQVEDRLAKMGVFGLMKEATRLIVQNFWLFFSFVTSFTIPCGIFTVFLLSAVDIRHRYGMEEFISRGEVVILWWKFETLLSPLALNFIFIILNLLPMALLNAVVCTRGVVECYKGDDLKTAIKNSFIDLQWGVLRLITTQFLFCAYLFIAMYLFLSHEHDPTLARIISISRWAALGLFLVFLYPLPASQVAILEPKNYGLRGIMRAARLAFTKLSTALGLAFFSLSYLVLLKGLVEIVLSVPLPPRFKFLVYPPLVVFVVTMTIFWQVVYALLYLSANAHLELEKTLIRPAMVEKIQASDIDQPLLTNEVGNSQEDSRS
ncbi:uncharacterized protein [Physcomitrium patens]|uniref:Transmembrane protein n=1 Tax=Physcomitrium patens TaxID=3218 RepID=A0A2K1L1R2_PHYPA|nr:uncharacterized protein LOC112275985 [Physcomitrium patens]PNR59969.1 hypothetical protein PHYPA_002761 [Physcomitrium patens]|eukprot:XP_024362658.1 uncharacterized protein LOC112275985 [Physcomitrella patens]